MNRSVYINYLKFIRKVGRPMSEINNGSDEIALQPDDALFAIGLLENSHLPILGGEIVSEDKKGQLIYALYLWGGEYCYLDWSCEKSTDNTEEYITASYELAKEKIIIANNVAKQLKKKCYIVLVV